MISIRNRSQDGGAYLTIDGQIGEPLEHDDLVVCRSSAYVVRLVRPPNQKFFDVLRAKLKWGERMKLRGRLLLCPHAPVQ